MARDSHETPRMREPRGTCSQQPRLPLRGAGSARLPARAAAVTKASSEQTGREAERPRGANRGALSAARELSAAARGTSRRDRAHRSVEVQVTLGLLSRPCREGAAAHTCPVCVPGVQLRRPAHARPARPVLSQAGSEAVAAGCVHATLCATRDVTEKMAPVTLDREKRANQ